MDEAREAGKLPRMHSRRRRLRSHKLTALLVVLVVIAGIGGASDLGYLALKSRADQLQASLSADLEAGQRDLEAGKTLLTQANSKHDASMVTLAINKFVTAKSNFLAAGKRADESRLLRYLEYIPAIGNLARSRHTAVDNIAQMGAALADAGQDVSQLDAEIIKPPAAGEAGRTLLTVLNLVQTGLVKVRTDLQSAQKAAAQIDVSVLPSGQQPTFVKARASIDSAVVGFAEFERLLPLLTEVLGGNGIRRYLIEQVNPAELRAGGGFIGTYSLLQADHGLLKLVASGDAYKLVDPRPLPGQAGFIPQPTPYREIIPDTSWSFVDSNIYPDYAANAKAAENFVQSRTGHLDGVISVDYYVVAQMLNLTGPIQVPGYGLKLDAGTFIPTLIAGDIAGDAAHKAILSSIAGPLLGKITSFGPDQWPTLLSTLNTLTAERHLQAYFNDPAVEDELDRIGWSGRLNTGSKSDFMMEVESNYYGTKSNYFVTRKYSIALARSGNTLRHEVAVDLVNNEPCGIETRTLYKSNIRLYIGADAFSMSDNLQPVAYSNPAPPAQTKLLDGWLFVNCGGGHAQGIFDYDTPWPAHDKAGVQIYWQKQPGTAADRVDVSWDPGIGGTFSAHGDLRQDRVIVLTNGGVTLDVGQSSQAALPSLSLG
jgi:hypothetical protein